MVMIKTIMEQLTGHPTVDALIRWWSENSPAFSADHQQYLDAMEILKKELPDPAMEEMEAIHRQSASSLLFSGMLGLKANLDHFTDPVARTFLDVDFEVYLREETAHRLPEYEDAQQVRDQFFSLLTPAQQKIYENVTTYTSHFETVGPKLAHYFGYMLGNELLPLIVPGYHADWVLTMRYADMLNRYFGKTPFGAM